MDRFSLNPSGSLCCENQNNYRGRGGRCVELLHYQIMQRLSPGLVHLNVGNFKIPIVFCKNR